MPNEIDTTSVVFNTDGAGFTSQFQLTDPTTWPDGSCSLPTLLPLNLPPLDDSFTSLNSDCQYQFPTILPIPPLYIPKPIVNLPCPTGYSFSSNVTFTSNGCSTLGGSLNIVSDPDTPCGYTLQGGIVIDVPCPPCPSGMSFSGSPYILVEGAKVTGNTGGNVISFALTGGPCNYQLVGGGTIVIPPPEDTGGGGSDTPGACQPCTATCADITSAIENAYSTKGTTPVAGDIIDLCNFVYQVIDNATSTCPNTIKVVPFTVASINYLARQLSTKCPSTPFFVTMNSDGTQATCTTGTLGYGPFTTGISITGLNEAQDVADGDLVYLEITISSLAVTAASIVMDSSFNPSATAFTTGSITEDDGASPPNQTIARYPIAQISGTNSIQSCFTNLSMYNMSINGIAAIYPVPV